MNKTKIIVVEDNIVYCEYVCNMLSREGYRNMKAYHLSTAKKHLQQATDNDIVVADLRLPDGSGIDLLCWMRKEGKMQPFIIMTDYAEVNTAVESMKLGSIDYIPKQLVEDKLVPLIRSILKERQAGQRRMPIFAREGSAFQKIMHRIRLVAATDMSVMIFGENGTGKEHIAHLLHDKSKRAGKPFVAVDCGSLSKELAPSAFFGHVKGAFTGADNAKKGYFHEAEGGTFARWLRDANPLPYYSFGNGAAMRVSPVGMIYDDAETTECMAGLTASVTHDHPEGFKGAKSVAHAMWMARHSYSKEAIRDEIERIFGYDLHMSCDDIRPTYMFNETCQGTVPQAIVAFLDSTDFEDAIRNAVSLGGDSDTLAAITGSIAEAYYGLPDDLCKKAMSYLPDEFKDIIDRFYKTLKNK